MAGQADSIVLTLTRLRQGSVSHAPKRNWVRALAAAAVLLFTGAVCASAQDAPAPNSARMNVAMPLRWEIRWRMVIVVAAGLG